MRRPCIECGTLADGTRCEPHRLAFERKRERATPTQRGYDAAWQRLSAEVRAGHPWCANCGATKALTVDHVVPRSMAGGLRVLCRSCHGAIGARTDRAARG